MNEYKSLKVSPKVHKKMKLHVAANDVNMVEFCDKAILNQIKSDRLEKKIIKTKP